MIMRPQWTTVWITGASSGIGREIALILAARGITIAVSARSADKLAELAARYPNIHAFPVDTTDAEAVARTAGTIDATLGPIDLAILSTGVWHRMGAADFDIAKAKETMRTNYDGVLNAVTPLMAAMRRRGSGHIAIVASVAGYRGLPTGAAYGPSKAALINLAESLRPELAKSGVAISVINPGFVQTPMTDVNTFPMPFIISADQAARSIVAGLERRAFEVVFPFRMAIAMKTLRLLPYKLFFWITGRM